MPLEKSYIHEFHYYDYIILCVFNFILSYILYKISEVGFRMPKKINIWLVLIFQINVVLIICDLYFTFLPDTLIQQQTAFMINSGKYPVYINNHLQGIYYLSLVLGPVCLNNIVFFQLLSLVIFYTGVLLILECRKPLKINLSQSALTSGVVLLTVAPILFVQITPPGYYTIVFILFAYFIYRCVTAYASGKYLALLLPALLLALSDQHMIYFILPVSMWCFTSHLSNTRRAYILAIIILVVSTILLIGAPEIFSPVKLAELRNNTVQHSSGYSFGNVQWTTYKNMLTDYVFIVLQFLTVPLPVFSGFEPLQHPVLLADMILFFVCLFAAIFSFRPAIAAHRILLMFAFLFILTISMQSVELYSSGVYRYFVLCIIVMIFLNKILPNKITAE